MSKCGHKSSPLRCELNKRWSQISHTSQEDRIREEVKYEKHMLQGSSAEHISIDSPPPSPCVKGVIEKSNSVSFILDLNDSLSDDSFLDLPPSPRPRSARTPTLQRRNLQKSISDKNCSSLLGNRINGQKWNAISCNGLKKNINGKTTERQENLTNFNHNGGCTIVNDIDEINGSNTPSPLSSLDHIVPGRQRCYSTSESSEGGEVERESPTGLSWTVPVHQNNSSSSPPKRQGLEPPPLHLRQPEEDEYEEISSDREFVEVVALGDVTPSEALSSLLAHTPTSSASPSDSELSQCGSRVGLSTESEEDTSEDEGEDPVGSTPNAKNWWVPQEGAGEAMIPEELLGQYQEVLGENCIKGKNIIPNHITSGPSSDSEDTHQALQNAALDASWSEDVECDLTSSSEMQEL